MDFKICLVVLLFSLAVAVESSKIHDIGFGLDIYGHGDDSSALDVSVGDVLGLDNEMMLDTESNRRQLRGRNRYISYGALRRGGVPCPRRGRSYYNCGGGRRRANPYRRGCTYITRCARRF